MEAGFKSEANDLIWPSEIGPNGFEPDPTLPRYLHNTTNLKFIEIPLLARYEIGRKKLSLFFELGFAPHIYINTKTTRSSNLGSESETTFGGKRLRMAVVLGFGMNYKVSDKFQLFIQPTARRYISNSNQPSFENRLRNIGLEFGIRRGFGFEKSE